MCVLEIIQITVHRVSKKLCKIVFATTSSHFHYFW